MTNFVIINLILIIVFVFLFVGTIISHAYLFAVLLVIMIGFMVSKAIPMIKAMSGEALYENKKVATRNLQVALKSEKDYKNINLIIEILNSGTEYKGVDGYVKLSNDITKKTYQQGLYFEGEMPAKLSTPVTVGIYTTIKTFQNIDKGDLTLSIDTGNDNIHIQTIKVTGQVA